MDWVHVNGLAQELANRMGNRLDLFGGGGSQQLLAHHRIVPHHGDKAIELETHGEPLKSSSSI
jgi:hypothetical protein